MRTGIRWLALLALGALLAGCATGPTGVVTTLPSLPTATVATQPTATATTAPLTTIAFICPATVNGAVKVFSDSLSGLTFDYPATWTEKDCHRYVAESIGPNGSTIAAQSILIGNLFIVSVTPRRGLTVQQFVSNVQGTNEMVTLSPLSVGHAIAAFRVSAATTPGADEQPRFAQTLAIVAGTENFYEVSGLDAVMSESDTLPGISNAALVQQVVTTFQVA